MIQEVEGKLLPEKLAAAYEPVNRRWLPGSFRPAVVNSTICQRARPARARPPVRMKLRRWAQKMGRRVQRLERAWPRRRGARGTET